MLFFWSENLKIKASKDGIGPCFLREIPTEEIQNIYTL